MANKRFSKFPSTGCPTGQRGPRHDKVPLNTMNWAGLPGKTQPKDRSNGVKKVKTHAVSQGI